MPALCYITTCKGRLAHLRQSLPRIVAQPDVACVVVDYSCPEGAGAWVEATHPQVRVVRAEGERDFNLSRARNLGAQAAAAPWLGFFDADILLDPAFTRTIVPQLTPGHFYRADPVTSQTWGSVICHRDDFARIGGYDEAYAGWGGEDDDLVSMLTMIGRQVAAFPAELLGEIAHSDEDRTRFYKVKDRRASSRVNQVYRRIKLDLLRLLGQPLALADRCALYAQIERILVAEGNDGGMLPGTVEINLPPLSYAGLPHNGLSEVLRLQRRMSYTLHRDGTVAVESANPG